MRRARGRKPGGARAWVRPSSALAAGEALRPEAGRGGPFAGTRPTRTRELVADAAPRSRPPPRGDPRPLRRVGALRWQRRGHSPEACLTRGCEMPTVPRISAQSRTGAAHAPVLHVGRYPALTRPRRESRAYGAPKPR